MVIFERRICGLLRYRRLFFPNRENALQVCRSLVSTDIVRMFAVVSDLGDQSHMIKHQVMLTTCIDLSLTPEQILAAMKRKSCRYEIRRAEKMLNTVQVDCNSDRALRDFLPLYNSFAKWKGPVPRLSPTRFTELSGHGDVFALYRENRAMSCHLLLRDDEQRTVRLLYSGSRRFESLEDASACGALNRYLHWYAMQHYRSQGFLTYDFGGIRNAAHPTAQFKLSFGGRVVTEHYYLFGGSRWLSKLGAVTYDRFFKAAAPNLSTH